MATRVGSTLSYVVSDPLGSNTIALSSTGQVSALQHYSPYGTVDYTWGSMPTSFNYAGERLDSQTGLLYDHFRYYDPVSGRFVRADTVQNNTGGMDPYAYVGDNPETRNDPSGHCWPLCTMLIGAVIGAAVSVATTVVSNAVQGKPTSLGEIAQSAVVGAVSGAVAGLAGPEAGPLAKVAVGALSAGAGQLVTNAMSGKPLMDGVGQAALVGGVTGGLMEGGSMLLKRGASEATEAAEDAEGILSQESKVDIPENKFKYFFGEVKSNLHNEERSRAMALQFKQLGVSFDADGRNLVSSNLRQAALDPTNVIATSTNQWGTSVTKQSLFAGPSGRFAAFESSWLMDDEGGLRLTTLIIKGVRIR
ncbi:MAG TPA: RHS repeat-associated core domain-containing protein [Ktedonobacteraceae bacterium]|nr:RHS repeat-associated core domain-containing protein [Ktedonobacteraceae bacterium]